MPHRYSPELKLRILSDAQETGMQACPSKAEASYTYLCRIEILTDRSVSDSPVKAEEHSDAGQRSAQSSPVKMSPLRASVARRLSMSHTPSSLGAARAGQQACLLSCTPLCYISHDTPDGDLTCILSACLPAWHLPFGCWVCAGRSHDEQALIYSPVMSKHDTMCVVSVQMLNAIPLQYMIKLLCTLQDHQLVRRSKAICPACSCRACCLPDLQH